MSTPTKPSFIDFESIDLSETPIEAREAFCEGVSAGQGLFAKEDVEAGTFLTRYPGKANWFTPKRDGDIHNPNKYSLVLGNFKVIDKYGKGLVNRLLAIELSEDYVPESAKYMGHLVNSCLPRCLEECYRSANALWGFDIKRLCLDCRVDPDVDLWLIAAVNIPKGVQVLIDYHWVFSYSGQWCLDSSCENCIYGLKTFVRKYC